MLGKAAGGGGGFNFSFSPESMMSVATKISFRPKQGNQTLAWTIFKLIMKSCLLKREVSECSHQDRERLLSFEFRVASPMPPRTRACDFRGQLGLGCASRPLCPAQSPLDRRPVSRAQA